MAKKITGRVEVWVNGIMLLNKAGAVASGIGVSGSPAFEREAIVGDTGVHGYLERYVPARCEVTVTDREDIILSDFSAINGDGTVVFKTAGGSGKVFTMPNATCLGNLSLTAGEGEVPMVFEGVSWVEAVQ